MRERWISQPNFIFFSSIATIVVSAVIGILLDVPILRQVSSFILLTLVPGLLFLSFLKSSRLGLTEWIVLSIGLSISFTVLYGLLLNYLLPAFGYDKPLSTFSLLIFFSIFIIALAIIGYFKNKSIAFFPATPKLIFSDKAFLLAPSLFPLVSIVGTRIMNLTDNNLVLMVLLSLIPIYVLLLVFFKGRVHDRMYPAIIFLISISLLLMYSLRSNHVLGSDVHREIFIFQAVADNYRWSQVNFGILDSALSISLLPAIYQAFLNIDAEYLFKLIYSLIFSISPLVVYLLSKKYVGPFFAFVSSVFFMSQVVFLWAPTYARSVTAILFFGLAMMVIFNDGLSNLNKKILFSIFAVVIVLSHYGTAYAAFFVWLFTWAGTKILAVIFSSQQGAKPGKSVENRRLNFSSKHFVTISLVVLFFAMLFFWYSEMTGPTFRMGIQFLYNSFVGWQWFLEEGTGGPVVEAAFGKTLSYAGVPQKIEFVFSWLTIGFIGFGLLATLVSIIISGNSSKNVKISSLAHKFEFEYLAMATACFLLLAATVIIPHISEGYGSAKLYLQMTVILSVFFVIGGIAVASFLKVHPQWLVLLVLVPYFLSTTGWVCQVFSFPRAITLNSEGELYDAIYILDAESYAAKWLKGYGDGTLIYARGRGRDLLSSQGKIRIYPQADARALGLNTDKALDGYIYLRHLDIISGLKEEYPTPFIDKGKIYANGSSEVYR